MKMEGGGVSGKTTRAIELFRAPLVLTPTHCLAKEMRAGGVQAQTYHSFFRWSKQTKWTLDRMGQKYIPRVIIWDEICTVQRHLLETFLDWLDHRGVQIVCCGDQGQPPPISADMPHAWLQQKADYYEKVETDYRAKDPALKDLKRKIHLQSDKVQCLEIRKALPDYPGWDKFVVEWKPSNLVLVSRQKVGNFAQEILFQRHLEYLPDIPVPLLYRPKDTRRQTILVTIPVPKPDQEKLVLNDVAMKYAREVPDGSWGTDWELSQFIVARA